MIIRVLTSVGLVCLAVITLAHPGATRMYAWPWTIAYVVALIAPAVVLVLRAFQPVRPLVLPTRGWTTLALVSGATILASAVLSPYRGPSLLWSAPLLAAIALFFVVFDWLHCRAAGPEQEHIRLRLVLLTALGLVGAVSLTMWAANIPAVGLYTALAARNAFPLGHSNYTAGLALLLLPLVGWEVAHRRGGVRYLAGAVALLALALLFTSGSRGGLIGLAVFGITSLAMAPLSTKRKWQLFAVCGVTGAAFILTNPRMRATFVPGPEQDILATSEVQRSAMATAGSRMGRDRPILGWGPGTTPLVYPRYRAALAGGAENVLQLHSTPVQIWGELGAAGILSVLGFVFLAVRDRRFDRVAAVTLVTYAAFSLTDWQLDVPIIAALCATLAAMLARPAAATELDAQRRIREPRIVGVATLAAVALVAFLGARDPAPQINAEALTTAQNPSQQDRAVELLRQSLAQNPNQEIAHFNLGWLLVVKDPAAAEKHFRTAARLVPDKGGVYFGLGLAALNQGKRDLAAHAFALECLNDPVFLGSPWWRESGISDMRDATARALDRFLSTPEIAKRHPGFSAASVGNVADGPERRYRRTRTGYPVLMRNLDIASPIDLYDVRESSAVATSSASLPPKGWLPSPLLLTLLDAPLSPTP